MGGNGPAIEMGDDAPGSLLTSNNQESGTTKDNIKRIILERHIAAHLQFIALMAMPGAKARFSDESIKSTSSSSSSSDGLEEPIPEISDSDSDIEYLRDLEPADATVEQGFPAPLPESEVLGWNGVYYALCAQNIHLRCKPSLTSTISFEGLTRPVFCPRMENFAFVDRRRAFRKLLVKMEKSISQDNEGIKKVALVGPGGVG